MSRILRRVDANDPVLTAKTSLDATTLEAAQAIVADVRSRGEQALREHAHRLGDLEHPDQGLVRTRSELEAAGRELAPAQRELLERTAARIRRFAEAQRACLGGLDLDVPGGRAGHDIAAVESAGCYAPGGRFPLPSSVLMTAVTARAAGVGKVWVASPRPGPVTLAAAAVAGADALLSVGGAQAIAALAFGAGPVPACDVIVGPGNRWVTAAKKLVFGHVGIDMLAGPSELVVLADHTADAATVAADLLAQAEHDVDARPILVTTHAVNITDVRSELERQLADLPTAETARAALERWGVSVLAANLQEACDIVNRIAPEHLELHVEDDRAVLAGLSHYGGLFRGSNAAEVFGDYGAGPNHVLPTAGNARHVGGLSVFHFLRVRTWLTVEPGTCGELVRDAAALARLEGLEAHARSAERRP